MSRGRPPPRGMDIAMPVAKARGRVIELMQNGDTPGDFEIIVGGVVIFVSLCRADPFHCIPTDIEAECRMRIARLRSVPVSARSTARFVSSVWRTPGCWRSGRTVCHSVPARPRRRPELTGTIRRRSDGWCIPAYPFAEGAAWILLPSTTENTLFFGMH